MRTRSIAALVAAGLIVAGCGGDDAEPESADAGQTSTEQSDAGEASDAAFPAECPEATPFDVEIRYDGDGEREVLTVTDAAAVRRSDGVAITVYLGDFTFPEDTSWSFTLPTVPEGSTLVGTGLDVFNATDVDALEPLEVGAEGGMFGDVGAGVTATFLSFTSDRAGSTSSNQSGTTTLLGVSDDAVCMTTSITADSGLELVGTFTAPFVADI